MLNTGAGGEEGGGVELSSFGTRLFNQLPLISAHFQNATAAGIPDSGPSRLTDAFLSLCLLKVQWVKFG